MFLYTTKIQNNKKQEGITLVKKLDSKLIEFGEKGSLLSEFIKKNYDDLTKDVETQKKLIQYLELSDQENKCTQKEGKDVLLKERIKFIEEKLKSETELEIAILFLLLNRTDKTEIIQALTIKLFKTDLQTFKTLYAALSEKAILSHSSGIKKAIEEEKIFMLTQLAKSDINTAKSAFLFALSEESESMIERIYALANHQDILIDNPSCIKLAKR